MGKAAAMTSEGTPSHSLQIRGRTVPRLGLGTWQLTGDECVDAVADALDIGYRHIDTARAYGNEREVGAGVKRSSVAREDVFLTTKIWMDDFEPQRLRRAAEDSLRELDTDYVDLLLLHWPNPGVPLQDSLSALSELRERGLTREIGVSNFPPKLLREAVALAAVFCDQVEYHPYLGQDDLLQIAGEADVMITAYAPLAHGKIFGDPTLSVIAERHNTGVGQVALAWLLAQPHVCVVPKAASHRNRVANFQAVDLNLTPEDRQAIDALPKDRREFDPAWAPDWND